jgi:photosystem II stability/assembly factor-like uncharacterized protein
MEIKQNTIMFLLILVLVVPLSAQWNWLNPLPQGNDLIDMAIWNEQLYTVGSGGVILQRTGNELELLDTNGLLPGETITGIEVCQGELFISTALGRLLTSPDGENWTVVYEAEDYYFLDLFMREDYGYALAYSDILEYNLLLFTENSGASWQQLEFGSFLDEALLMSLEFSDQNHGYVTGMGCILKTDNGGDEWDITYINEDAAIYDISVVNSNTAFAVAETNEQILILKTENEGADWYVCGENFTDPLYSIAFQDETNGYAGGNWGLLVVTENGGNTWELTETATNNLIGGIKFNQNELVIYGSGGYFARSEDSGSNWQEYSSGTMNGKIRSVDLQCQNGIAVGDCNIFLITEDGGASWEKKYLEWDNDPDLINHIYTKIFPDKIDIYGNDYNTGNSFHAISEDNGMNWDIISFDDIQIDDIYFLTDETGWLVSALDIYKTENGGQNWDLLFSSNIAISRIAFRNELGGVFTDCAGRIFKTENGGSAWTQCFAGVPDDLDKLQLLPDGRIFVAGYAECVFSPDEGITWETVYEVSWEEAKYVRAIYFSEENDNFICLEDYSTGFKQNSIITAQGYPYNWQTIDFPSNCTVNTIVDCQEHLLFAGENASILSLDTNNYHQETEIIPLVKIWNYPNPGRLSINGTNICSNASNIRGNVSVSVYNLKGQLIRNDLSGNLQEGINWNGRDAMNRLQSPGIYLLQIKSREGIYYSKTVMLN